MHEDDPDAEICNTGDNDCCSPSNRCGLMEGDCDKDEDCVDGLVCSEGLDNCKNMGLPGFGAQSLNPDAFSATDDCCTFSEDMMEYIKQWQ